MCRPNLASPLPQHTCHTGSRGVTCHPAEVTFPPLPQPKLVLDLATPDGYARLRRPRYCSQDAQPLPKTAYHSGRRDKHRADHYLHVPIVYSVERKRSNRKHQTPPRTSAAPWRVCLSIRRRAKFVLPLVASLTGCLADSEQNLRHPQSRKCITYPVADPGCPDTRPFV